MKNNTNNVIQFPTKEIIRDEKHEYDVWINLSVIQGVCDRIHANVDKFLYKDKKSDPPIYSCICSLDENMSKILKQIHNDITKIQHFYDDTLKTIENYDSKTR